MNKIYLIPLVALLSISSVVIADNSSISCSKNVISGIGVWSNQGEAKKVARIVWRANVIKKHGLSIDTAKYIAWSLSEDKSSSCSRLFGVSKCTVKARPCSIERLF